MSLFSPHTPWPLIMGILNITPDSFSGDGVMSSENMVEAALSRAIQMVRDGAHILDVGGESTRPGAEPVSAIEEMERIIPVIEAIHKEMHEIPISVDTMKPAVARAALSAGATILNDVSGLAQEPEMRALAAESGVYLVLMHNQASANAVNREEIIGGEYKAPEYKNVVEETLAELSLLAALAKEDGVAEDRIILDPGIGFGKTAEQNMQLINAIDQIKLLGHQVLLGASRKSFIGRVLDVPLEERLEGTAAVTAIGTLRGADIHRVHDVRFMARVARMAAAIQKIEQNNVDEKEAG